MLASIVLLVLSGVACGFEPDSYRFSADFNQRVAVPEGADVRIGGVSVGEVTEIEAQSTGQRVTMEIDPDYAPLDSDTKAILRQKTLLGEIYVELARGSEIQGPGTLSRGK